MNYRKVLAYAACQLLERVYGRTIKGQIHIVITHPGTGCTLTIPARVNSDSPPPWVPYEPVPGSVSVSGPGPLSVPGLASSKVLLFSPDEEAILGVLKKNGATKLESLVDLAEIERSKLSTILGQISARGAVKRTSDGYAIDYA